jgi:hypothetical protein
MDENFVGYTLGTLDSVTHARVETYLKAHPEAHDRLEQIANILAPLAEDADDPVPPPGLALATLARVAEHACALPSAPAPTPHQVGPRRSLRHADWLVAAILLVLVGGIALPFTVRQWQTYQRMACGENLRKFWVALNAYSDRTEGEFPRIEANGPRSVAGIFVPILTDNGLARDVSIECPARGNREPTTRTVAELERLHAQSSNEYQLAVRELAGHYAYCLGYSENGTLRGLRRGSDDGLPILSDRSVDGTSNSFNHPSAGQNVLYVGGNVRWATVPTVGLAGDHIFVNHRNRVQAGVCRGDSVLGASDARPIFVE